MGKKSSVMTMETTERQKKYVAEQESKGNGLGVVFADAFLRGMRDLGYKNPAWALCEQIDNSIQSSATNVAVRFGFEPKNKSKAKPDMIAIVDNGVGMIPKMIGYAVRWGGTDREDNREGFGRYGYGLPSSAVSLAKRYTVYSKIKGGSWHAVTVDIEDLAKAAGDYEATNKLLTPREAAPPEWSIEKSASVDFSKADSGTVIVLEDLDRLRRLQGWITAAALKGKLLRAFGVIYRHWLPQPRLVVDDTVVLPVDPLFLMEHARFFDETPVRAQRVDAHSFEVESPRGKTGLVKIRASYLPANFQQKDPSQPVRRGNEMNDRFDIMKDYNGLLICRSGRQIDCISPNWTKFQNYDQHVKIEIDFSPELDEYFGVSTSKQQITFDDVFMSVLIQKGKLKELVKDIRRRFDQEQQEMQAKEQNDLSREQPRPSEQAMEESEKFKPRPDAPSAEKVEKARKHLDERAAKIAETTERPKEEVAAELTEKTSARRFEVEFQAIPEGPFYRPVRLGDQKRLIVNTLHPFYSKVYNAPPQVQAALEVLLFVIAEAELEAEGEMEQFYLAARNTWSERLRHALEKLVSSQSVRDRGSADSEQPEPIGAINAA